MNLIDISTAAAYILRPQDFIILALALWRISSLFANEGGPFDLFARFRTWAGVVCNDGDCTGTNWFAKGLSCEWCNSVWFGTLMVVAYLFLGRLVVMACLPLALSTVVIFVKYLIEFLRK